ncbi:ABC transporter ATP-binding protein [Shouchella lonarensis]|uniref:ABC-2 type transport system ATP-binding protein n=1 Tax=Shouchella lonarensis TaxID=1464122 RepID=A0A1G6HCQ7_9BACI|nr:ABC transporter ATP-binding protein [Shouchella lonarensis]SDB91868.1 ABC-2 type transport system ATP-binding protein [Shouchella lonarensis]
MLEVVDLSKSYRKQQVVKGINMFIEKGEMIGLVGPNGAGKSTTISMIASLIQPTEGDILIKGKSIRKKPQAIREILGIVPQEIAIYPDLTARENLIFFGRIYGLKHTQLQDQIKKTLQLVGLEERQSDRVHTFSGGMKRRLNIAVALLHQPEIIIMDEPTVGIDPQSRSHILETIKSLNREYGMTVIYTSHYMEEVEYLCDRLYIMDQGHMIASGSKEEVKGILSSNETIAISVVHESPHFLAALQSHPNILSVKMEGRTLTMIVAKQDNILEDLFTLAREAKVVVSAINIQTPTLEDVFLHLTGRTLRD